MDFLFLFFFPFVCLLPYHVFCFSFHLFHAFSFSSTLNVCFFARVELLFLETSALTGENVEEGFLKCARIILNKIDSGTVLICLLKRCVRVGRFCESMQTFACFYL